MSGGLRSADCHCLVADLPDQGPVISGSLPRYKKGDLISANCTSLSSVPAAKLNWYINGQVTPQKHLIEYPLTSSRIQLYSSTLGLRWV